MAKVKVKSEFDIAVEDFFKAAREVRQAQNNFDNATPEYFDIANKALTIARENFDLAGKRVKKLDMPN